MARMDLMSEERPGKAWLTSNWLKQGESSRARLGTLFLLIVVFGCGILLLARDHLVDLASERTGLLLSLAARHPVALPAAYLLLSVVVTAVSLPGVIPLMVGAGWIFGPVEGVALGSFASSIGATLACASARYLFRGWADRRFGAWIARVDGGLQRHGGTCLLSLRLAPFVPFAMINAVFGLTRFPIRRFYWISQLGMLPATTIYVGTGSMLTSMPTRASASWPAVSALFILAILPVLWNRFAHRVEAL